MGEGYRHNKVNMNQDILNVLREVYKSGTVVLADNVEGIERGTKGVTKMVKNTGDIVVNWESGYSSTVKHGVETLRIYVEGICILEGTTAWGECNRKGCNRCGWNKRVYEKRLKKIHSGGMEKLVDGTVALSVKK